MIDTLVEFPKPFICAVNGLGLGIGTTILGFADLSFMATDARLKCPFTSLGVAPEAASSFTFPNLLGRQQATWMLLSSEWITAPECHEMGLVFKVCEPDELLPVTMQHAQVLAQQPISSLVESKRLITASWRERIDAARAGENQAFQKLMAGPGQPGGPAGVRREAQARLHHAPARAGDARLGAATPRQCSDLVSFS